MKLRSSRFRTGKRKCLFAQGLPDCSVEMCTVCVHGRSPCNTFGKITTTECGEGHLDETGQFHGRRAYQAAMVAGSNPEAV